MPHDPHDEMGQALAHEAVRDAFRRGEPVELTAKVRLAALVDDEPEIVVRERVRRTLRICGRAERDERPNPLIFEQSTFDSACERAEVLGAHRGLDAACHGSGTASCRASVAAGELGN